MPAAIAENLTLKVSRLIKAPPERVFATWTTPQEILKWFGPETCQPLSANIDLRPGGKYQVRIKSEKMGEVEVRGVYREVKPPAKLVYTWNWSGNPDLAFGESLVTVQFQDRQGSTEVEITHENLPSAELRDDHNHSWNGCLDKLARLMSTASSQQGSPHRIVWCDIPVTDLDRAVRFYSAVLGEPVKKEVHSGMTFAVLPHKEHAVSGCLTPGCSGHEAKPSAEGPLLYVNCQGRLEQSIAAVEANGGKVLQPKEAIGPYGFRAVVLDSEGNRIALHSM